MKSVAILITCHNRLQKTISCLNSVYKSISTLEYHFDIFLVDDGSTDGTSEEVRITYPYVNIIKGTGSLYWNRGMCLAWKTAISCRNYDYYLWLNNDTFILDGGMVEMLECESACGESAIVCGAFRSKKYDEFTYGGRRFDGTPVLPNGIIQHCSKINGNCVLVSRAIYETIGILDSVYPHAIADYDYGLRALKHKFKVVTTRSYIGFCERNSNLPMWCYSNVPIIERFKNLYSPLGNSHPKYFFIFERRYFGILLATKHFLSIHLRALFPNLWSQHIQ